MIGSLELSKTIGEAHALTSQAALKLGGIAALAGVGRCLTSDLATEIDKLKKRAASLASESHEILSLSVSLAEALEGCEREDLLQQASDAMTDFVQAKQGADAGDPDCTAFVLSSDRENARFLLGEIEEIPAHRWSDEQHEQIAVLRREYEDTKRAIVLGVPLSQVLRVRADLDQFCGLVARALEAYKPGEQDRAKKEASKEAIRPLLESALRLGLDLAPKLEQLSEEDRRKYQRAEEDRKTLHDCCRTPEEIKEAVTTETAREIEPWLSDLEAEATRAIENCAGSSRLLHKAIGAWNKAAGKGAGLPAPYHARFLAVSNKLYAKIKEIEANRPN